MRLTRVDGLIRLPTQRGVNGIQCDNCGAVVSFRRQDAETELTRLVEAGWTGDTAKENGPHYCPQCSDGRAILDQERGDG